MGRIVPDRKAVLAAEDVPCTPLALGLNRKITLLQAPSDLDSSEKALYG